MASAGSPAAALTMRQPIQGRKVFENWGVCTHPTFGDAVYKWSSEVIERIGSINGHKHRGMYPPKRHRATTRSPPAD